MDRPRGRATGGRTRGRAAPTGDPSQTAPLSGAWAARGRGNSGGGPPPAGSQPSEPVDKLTQQVKAVALAPTGSPSGEANPSDAGVARGQGDKGGRGANRHTNVPRKEEVHRPAHLTVKQGTKGVKAIFQTNYFRLTSAVDLHLYQYRVDFNPDPDVTVIKKALLKIHKERFGAIFIFDGTVLLTRERFKELSLISERKDGTPVQIKIKHTADMAPGDPHYCHLFNHVLRTCSEVMGLELLRRDYFDPNGKVTLSQYNLEVWPGFKTSFLQCEEEVLLNVDFVSRVIRLDTAYTLLEETRMEGRDKWKDLFFNAVLGTTVTTRFNNKSYRVDDVEFTGNPNSTFEIKSQGKTSKISYRDYYRQKYQIEIKNMDQPLLVSKPSNKDIRQKGAAATPVKLVPELCFLTGVTDRMRANRSLMTALDEHVKLEPGSRIKKMEQGFMKRMTDHKDVKELLKRWNLNLEPTFLSLAGRVIEPENIIVGGGKTVPVDRRTGDFTRGLTGSRAPFLHCVPLQSWAIVFTKRMADSDIKAFSDTILRAAETFRFQISRPHLLPINDDRGGSYAAAIETCVNNKATMVMCILPNDRKDRYDAIKRKCYIQRSIPNQVVLMKNVAKKNMSVATKIAIQMSCKIGGTPWAVSIPLKGTMIVGFDVCHDTTNKLQSHGALVATIDEKFTRYASFVNPHEAHNELSNFMGVNMTKAIVTYRQANEGRIPAKIIFYRDGVGEGNIDYTKDHEVGAISTALAGIYGAPDKVPLTFIIVTKRISTRFFSNGGNPPPGSIVDSVVTRPIWYDFYLVSQSVTRGTATPTSYNVVHDANNLKPDVVQQLSYRLCHTYFNWSGALRVPAPCQYAHKLAFLVAQHLHAPPAEGMNTLLYFL